MGKRNFKTGKGFVKRDKAPKNGGEWTEVSRENAKWETYYKSSGLIPEDEWDTFKEHCQRDLPLTFRITGSRKHALEVNQKFIDDHVSKLLHEEFEGQKLAPKNLEFYPDQLGWQLDVPKSVIRKNAQYAETQRFLVLETVVGNISRQEAVSMIPPLLMDVKPHHAVLDMCAAPGSKTAQIVEALHMNDDNELPTGILIANDSDYKRSHMLVHQVKRLNSPNFLVVNHDAAMFPRINVDGQIMKFDRILCDVPCSGDGTMRKNVNVWKDFTVGNGLGLHALQVNILNRGLQLLKPGGRLVYSTCSMSPIENEAVVSEALRRWGDKVQLKDCSGELPGLKRRPGVSSWQVYGKDMTVREKGDETVPASAFPPSEEEAKKFHLDRCIRVYPHLQNTGGFFITVFEKPEAENGSKRSAPEDETEPKRPKTETAPVKKQKAPRTANEEPFVFLDPNNEELQRCWKFYGVSDKFPKDTALVRNAMGEACRTIYYVSPTVAQILRIEQQKLKLVHAGIKMFTVQRADVTDCNWRVQSESLHILKNFLGDARMVTGNIEMLKHLLQNAFVQMEPLRETGIDDALCKQLDSMSEGCVFLNVAREGKEDAFFPMWKGRNNINLMVNKHDTQELLMRYFDIATSAKDEGKEKKYQKAVEARKSEQPESEQEKETKQEDTKQEKEE